MVLPNAQVWLGGQWFTVVGVLRPVPLAPELDFAALVGWPAAASHLRFDRHPTPVYTRTRDDAVTIVAAILAATANPQNPNEVDVSRPSDALAARQATDTMLTALLGLGAVARAGRRRGEPNLSMVDWWGARGSNPEPTD